MADFVLLQVSPLLAAGTTTVNVRLAGGGSKPYAGYLGFSDWKAGAVAMPRYTTQIGFDQGGWNGGAVPQAAIVEVGTRTSPEASGLAAYFWKKAPITIKTGNDAVAGLGIVTRLVGTVADAAMSGGVLRLTVSDLSGDLDKPVLPNTFAGTGGIEGPSEATGRAKRRSWGRAFNVEGLILDKANNIYEFGDPARPLDSFVAIKDKGREGPMTTVAWAGSIAATLAALQAAVAPQGGGVAAASIACVKWWTVPSGPLTADMTGEVLNGYTDNPVTLASRIIAATTATISPALTINEARAYPCGIHCDQASETVAQVLDRLLLPLSLVWVLSPAGTVTINGFRWTAPVETLRSIDQIDRETVFLPLATRKLGYRRNNRVHSDAEISAAITEYAGTMGDIADIHVAADSAGVRVDGQLPQVRNITRLWGDQDVTPQSDVAVAITGGVTFTLNNTPDDDDRGTLSIDDQAVPKETTVTATTTYNGSPLVRQFKIFRDDAGAPSTGGGGGGGTPGTPSSVNVFTPPLSSGSYVLMATIPNVTTGTGGQVDVSINLTFDVQFSQGSIDPSVTDPHETNLDILVEYTTNGGGSWTTATPSSYVQSPGYKYYQFIVPKGNYSGPGSTYFAKSITGLGSGTVVGVRISGIQAAGFTGTPHGVSSVYGTGTSQPS